MENRVKDAKREELYAKYSSTIKKSDMHLDELHTKNLDIEKGLDEIHSFQQNIKYMLEHYKDELARHDSHEELDLFNMIEDEIQSNCRSTEYALLDAKDELERKRKQIFRDREDMEYEYKRALYALSENGH